MIDIEDVKSMLEHLYIPFEKVFGAISKKPKSHFNSIRLKHAQEISYMSMSMLLGSDNLVFSN